MISSASRMSQTWLISGSPGCGKTSWILKTMRSHQGKCGYLRLDGYSSNGLEQVSDSGIDKTLLKDQFPELIDLSDSHHASRSQQGDLLTLIELPQFQAPQHAGLTDMDPRVKNQLETCLLYTSPSPRDKRQSRMPSSA